MTEERMIRVIESMYDEIQKYVWYTTDGYDTAVNFKYLPTWNELELAPPIGSVYVDPSWLPECYMHNYTTNNCEPRFLEDGSMNLACVYCHILNRK